MPKIKVFILIISLFGLFSCQKNATFNQKSYPLLQTLNVSDIDTNRVVFNAEFLELGIDKIEEYGFVFTDASLFNAESTDTIRVGLNDTKESFTVSITDKLVGNLTYNVKAYAYTDKQMIFGNEVEFTSMGSRWEPWYLNLVTELDYGSDVHSISNDKTGFLLFGNENFYAYDPDSNQFKSLQKIPVDVYSANSYASFIWNGQIHVLTSHSNKIQVYNINADEWQANIDRPFKPNPIRGFCGFTINDTGYFLDIDNFYAFDPANNSWLSKADFPGTRIYSSLVLGDFVYIFSTGNTIWRYDQLNNSWQFETEYPGEWNGYIAGFETSGNLYWGLSSNNGKVAKDFWAYTPATKTWERVSDFPAYHHHSLVFSFSVGNFGYVGYITGVSTINKEIFPIFKFDPKKIGP